MTFTLLPAVDVANGRVVWSTQTDADIEDAPADPLQAAFKWQAEGAAWIHLVDLDAAYGRGSNAELLGAVARALDVKVELSGGIHDDVSLDTALSTGCERLVLSTVAVENQAWCTQVIAEHGERIAVALDVRVSQDGNGAVRHQLAARGRTEQTGQNRQSAGLWETLDWLDRAGCTRYVVTDADTDGMLLGPNLALYRAVTEATATPVLASGGISAISDLVVLAKAAADGANIEGSIVGAALSSGRFSLSNALEAIHEIDLGDQRQRPGEDELPGRCAGGDDRI